MKSRVQASHAPWSEWMLLDDRKVLEFLYQELGKKNGTYHPERLPYIRDIVTSIHFFSHSRWQVGPNEKDVKILCDKFAVWLKERDFAKKMLGLWRQNPDTVSHSLPFWLSREFVRFQQARAPKKVPSDLSYSSYRAMLELPQSTHFSFSDISHPVLDAFMSFTQQLPSEVRLSYQLHLEGLLEDEIAFITGLDLQSVKRQIQIAKDYIQRDFDRGEYGT